MKTLFLPPHDPRLQQPTPPIPLTELTSPTTQAALERLYQVAHPNQNDHSKAVLVGLAAPQIGLAHRIILIDVAANGRGHVGDLRAYLNPTIVKQSAEQADWYEGCYSTGHLCGIVPRPQRITIQAYAPNGQSVTEQHDGYVSRIFQHEIDHLDGRFFIDRITNDQHLHLVDPADFPAYRDQQGWRHWTKTYTRKHWEQLRAPKPQIQ